LAESRTVLIVEEQRPAAADLRDIVTSLGYEATGIASTAEEALARANERRPDVALVDVRVRGKLDGIKTAEMLRESLGVPIIYVAAKADDVTVERAAKTHPSAYLLKPVNREELKSALEIALYREPDEAASVPDGATQERHRGGRPRPPGTAVVRRHLERVLESPDFDAARRSREFLQFIVEEQLAGRGSDLTQPLIAHRVFGRREDFDPLADPIVRIQAGRLRRSLERYYLLAGKHDALHIELPRGGYVPIFHAVEARSPAPAAPAVQLAPAAPVFDDWPRIVVRPLRFDASDSYLSERAVEFDEILNAELGRYQDVRPIALSETSATPEGGYFELDGTLRWEAESLRVNVRLVRRPSGEQAWAESFRALPEAGRRVRSLSDAARQAAARVGSEEGVIVQALAAEGRRRGFAASSYGAVLRSYDFYFVRDAQRFGETLDMLESAVAAAPECSLAWTRLARLYMANHAFEVSPRATPIAEAIRFAQNGVRLDPTSRRARCLLGGTLLVSGDRDAAWREAEEALRRTPDSLVYLEIVGWLFTLSGDWERGAELTREAVERNPYHLPHAAHALWLEAIRRGDYDAAHVQALNYRDTAFFWRALMRASSLGLLGRVSEAAPAVAEILALKPGFAGRGRELVRRYVKFEDLVDRIADGLARAGLELE
jgi:adenylate cyclase